MIVGIVVRGSVNKSQREGLDSCVDGFDDRWADGHGTRSNMAWEEERVSMPY